MAKITFLSTIDPRWYLKSKISKNFQPILTHNVSNETSLLHLVILKKKCSKFLSFYKKNTSVLLNFFFCQHLCSMSTNEVSNEMFNTHYQVQSKNLKKTLKKIMTEMRKLQKAQAEEPMPKFFISFKTYCFSLRSKQQKKKIQSGETYA